ncbi:hypothetical protein V1512DRAFT_50918 [Lipomyces arxii]|uniref:uncharacterized protein n=1 Tax=Lipomyces arxii TaxID=56418 RepID=UPI0034CDAAB5
MQPLKIVILAAFFAVAFSSSLTSTYSINDDDHKIEHRTFESERIVVVADVVLFVVTVLDLILKIKKVPKCWGKYCKESSELNVHRRDLTATAAAVLSDIEINFKSLDDAIKSLENKTEQATTNYSTQWTSNDVDIIILRNLNISVNSELDFTVIHEGSLTWESVNTEGLVDITVLLQTVGSALSTQYIPDLLNSTSINAISPFDIVETGNGRTVHVNETLVNVKTLCSSELAALCGVNSRFRTSKNPTL